MSIQRLKIDQGNKFRQVTRPMQQSKGSAESRVTAVCPVSLLPACLCCVALSPLALHFRARSKAARQARRNYKASGGAISICKSRGPCSLVYALCVAVPALCVPSLHVALSLSSAHSTGFSVSLSPAVSGTDHALAGKYVALGRVGGPGYN